MKPSRVLIYRAIKHYEELWWFEDRAWCGRLKSVRAEATIKTERERIRRNPFWKQKIMSRKLNISNQSSSASSGTIKHMTAHRRSKGHLLTPAMKEVRRIRAERLFQGHAENGYENIFFTDETIFTI